MTDSGLHPGTPAGFVNIGRESRGQRIDWIWLGLSIVSAALCLLVVFRPFWLSHFDMVLSDPVDGRFSLSILEHWSRVFHGQSPFASPNFFFPERGVLGYSDTFFLLAIPYSILRWAGVDRYLAFQITMMLLTTIGFASMLYVLRRIMGFSRISALTGALLFATFNMYYLHIVHPQLASVTFFPVLLLLAAKYSVNKTLRPGLSRIYICAVGALAGLLFLTSFYVGWFIVIFCATASLLLLGLTVIAERSTLPLLRASTAVWNQRWGLLVGAGSFAMALIPFFLVYLPAFRQTGTRSLVNTIYYMPSALSVFDVGKHNIIWGRVSGRIENYINPEGMHEHPFGWPYVTLFLFLATFSYCILRMFNARSISHPPGAHRFRAISSLSLSCVALWLAGVTIRGQAPIWAIFWKLVPGAAAIRVPTRANVVLGAAIVMICMFGVEFLRRTLAERRIQRQLASVLLPAVLLVEQLNFAPTHLISRAEEAKKFSKIMSPPKTCSVFYISNWSNTASGMRTYQTDAMLLAEQFEIPTINGYSGWFPSDWRLLNGSAAHVAQEARTWAAEHALSGLCALDLNSGQWSPVSTRGPVADMQFSERRDRPFQRQILVSESFVKNQR